MKITPSDLNSPPFPTAFRGYNREEVDAFLERLRVEYETLFNENRRFREETERLKARIVDYEEVEKTLKQTLVSAQRTSGELKTHAEKEAELIIREAEINAEKLIEEARDEARDLLGRIRELKKQKRSISSDVRALLRSYLEALDDLDNQDKLSKKSSQGKVVNS